MELQVTALLFLIGAIILGFVKKINVGLVCLGFSLILGTIGGMGAGDIYKVADIMLERDWKKR